MTFERAMAPAAGRTAIVAGYFDPLTAAHVRRLRELKSQADRLIAIVLDPPEPLLDSRARCELVAALECVDVVTAGGAAALPANVIHEEAADLDRRADLIARVRARHGTPA